MKMVTKKAVERKHGFTERTVKGQGRAMETKKIISANLMNERESEGS